MVDFTKEVPAKIHVVGLEVLANEVEEFLKHSTDDASEAQVYRARVHEALEHVEMVDSGERGRAYTFFKKKSEELRNG